MNKPCKGCTNTTVDGRCTFVAPEEICCPYAKYLGYQEGLAQGRQEMGKEIVEWLLHWTELNEPDFERLYGIRQSGVNIPNLRQDLEAWLERGQGC